MMGSDKQKTNIRSILSMDRLQKQERNKLRSLIPPKTLGGCTHEGCEDKRMHKMREEVREGKVVHRGAQAPTNLSLKKQVLREWTKGRPTIVPQKVLSHITEEKNKVYFINERVGSKKESKKKQRNSRKH